MGGTIDFMIDLAASSLPQVRAGTVNAFAVKADRRLASISEVPSVAEVGFLRLQMRAPTDSEQPIDPEQWFRMIAITCSRRSRSVFGVCGQV